MNIITISTSILKKSAFAVLCLALSGLFLISGCKKDLINTPEPEPIEIQYREYTLHPTECHWANLSYDGEVILVNDNEKMENFIDPNFLDFYYEHGKIDFSKNSLILVSGVSKNHDAYIVKKFQKLSDDKYMIDADFFLTPGTPTCKWHFAIYVDKISDESTIELKTKTSVAETDYYYNTNGEKEWLGVRKDYIVIKCKSKNDATELFNELWHEPYFSAAWGGAYYEEWNCESRKIVYAMVKPLQGVLENIMQKPQVISVTYGLEPIKSDNKTVCFSRGYIEVKPKEGITIEQILNELGITGYTFELPVDSNAPSLLFDGTFIFFEKNLNILEMSRKIYESGKCEFAIPNLVPQVSLCM